MKLSFIYAILITSYLCAAQRGREWERMLEVRSVLSYLHVTHMPVPGMRVRIGGTEVYGVRSSSRDGLSASNALDAVLKLERAFEESASRILNALYDPEEASDLIKFLCADDKEVLPQLPATEPITRTQLAPPSAARPRMPSAWDFVEDDV